MQGKKRDNAVFQNVLAYKSGFLLIVGAVYDLESGKVEFLKEMLENYPT
jgi:hypothetical protein